MGKKKRQFIDKKTAHKFTVGHRSQRDPLQADEESSQHVLIPIGDTSDHAANSMDDDPNKFGIYYDDGYDYMQHLRARGEGMLILADDLPEVGIEYGTDFQEKKNEKVAFGKLLLPSEALPSQKEEKVGMLAKGVLPKGPQPHWDPDIVAALDGDLLEDDDDPDNFLEDNFMMLANGGTCDVTDLEEENVLDHHACHMQAGSNDWESVSEGSSVEVDSDDLLSDEEFDEFAKEETKTRFTNYSMTSSVIRRTAGLKLLDDRFERLMEEYDEEEIGCIEHEEVAGNFDPNNELVTQVVDEFINEQKTHELSEIKTDESKQDGDEDMCGSGDSDEETDEQLFAQFEKKPKEKWDCESIISTYSNIYNHPKLIIEEKKPKKYELDKNTGLPVGILEDRKTSKYPAEAVGKIEQQVVLNNIRNKDENAEQKKLRKQNVKEHRKNRRAEKKSNKMAFRSEYIKQEKSILNTVAQKGVKL